MLQYKLCQENAEEIFILPIFLASKFSSSFVALKESTTYSELGLLVNIHSGEIEQLVPAFFAAAIKIASLGKNVENIFEKGMRFSKFLNLWYCCLIQKCHKKKDSMFFIKRILKWLFVVFDFVIGFFCPKSHVLLIGSICVRVCLRI